MLKRRVCFWKLGVCVFAFWWVIGGGQIWNLENVNANEFNVAVSVPAIEMDRFEKIENECIKKSFENVECRFYKNDPLLENILASAEMNATTEEQKDYYFEIKENMKSALFKGMKKPKSEKENFEKFILILNQVPGKFRKEKLKTCQKVCVVTCMSSKIIRYAYLKDSLELHNLIKSLSPQQSLILEILSLQKETPDVGLKESSIGAIKSGKGVCRQSSYIARDILKSLKLPGRSVIGELPYKSSYKHEVVQTKIDGKTYLIEPQSDQCNFYPVGKLNPFDSDGNIFTADQFKAYLEEFEYLQGTGPNVLDL